MEMRKPRDELVELFLSLAPDDPSVTVKKMFGQYGLFCDGNMFAGVHEDDVVLRLPAEGREELLGIAGAQPFEPMGRPMREYVCVPPAMQSNPTALSSWMARSLTFAHTLPAKEKREQRRRARAS